MSDPSTLAIVASTLLGKTVTEIREDGFTIITPIETYEQAIVHALKLLQKTTPSYTPR